MRRRTACAVFVLLAPALFAPALSLIDVPLSPDDMKNVEDFNSQDWRLGRVLGVNATSLVTPRLRALAGSGALLGRLNNYMEDVVSGPGAIFKCDLSNSEWSKALNGFLALRSWPLVNTDCVSTSSARKEKLVTKPEVALEMTYNLMYMMRVIAPDILEDAGNSVKALFEKKRVKEPTSDVWHYSSGRYKRCTMERLTAVRLRPKKGAHAQWYFLTGVTNTDRLKDLADKRRFYLNEWIGVDSENSFVDPIAMKLRPWDGSDGEGDIKLSEDPKKNGSNFANSFERWGGRVGLSAIHNLPGDDSPALKLALEKSDVPAGQAEDALTASNIGILALPMALNVIPIALVADVSSVGLFAYTVMTDILTTIPFIIKGFELFLAGSKFYAAQEVYYTDFSRDSVTSGEVSWIVAESWTSECRLVDLRRVGSLFIAAGFTMLFLGAFLEYQARRLRSRWISCGTLRNEFKAGDLENDMLKSFGLIPPKSCNSDVAEEEQSFLDNQVKPILLKNHSPGSSSTVSTTSRSRLGSSSGVSGPSSGQNNSPNTSRGQKGM